MASGEPGPKTVGTSMPVFSRTVLAVATAPTSQPARVYGTQGAGEIFPSSLIISGVKSVWAGGKRRTGRVVDRRRPVGERHSRPGTAARGEVAEGVRHRLTHAVRVDAGQRGQDAGCGV